MSGLFEKLVSEAKCLIEGPVKADNLQEFWKVREQFLTQAYPGSENIYEKDVAAEFEKLIDLPEHSEINLWFEYELFCQANMWFCVDLLRNSKAKVYRVEPVVRTGDDIWKGFGDLSPDELKICFAARKMFSPEDIRRYCRAVDSAKTVEDLRGLAL